MDPEGQKVIRAKTRALNLEVAKSRSGQGELPKSFLDQYDAANGMSQGRQAALRKIAMAAVEQLPGTNKYKICIKKPLFEEWRETNTSDYGVHRQEGQS